METNKNLEAFLERLLATEEAPSKVVLEFPEQDREQLLREAFLVSKGLLKASDTKKN